MIYLGKSKTKRFTNQYRNKKENNTVKTYPTIKIVVVVGGTPTKLELNKHEQTMNNADPFALSVTPNGMVNRDTLGSTPSFFSQTYSMSGIVTALKKHVTCILIKGAFHNPYVTSATYVFGIVDFLRRFQ